MSYQLETLNRGKINVGFPDVDTSRVNLGELPTISLSQFCAFAPETLIEAYNQADPDKKQRIRDFVIGWGRVAIEGLEIRDEKPLLAVPKAFYELDGLLSSMYIQASKSGDRSFVSILAGEMARINNDRNGNLIHNYVENPFKAKKSKVLMGDVYEVDPFQFSVFTIYVVSGVFTGWHRDYGIPKVAFEAYQKLSKALFD